MIRARGTTSPREVQLLTGFSLLYIGLNIWNISPQALPVYPFLPYVFNSLIQYHFHNMYLIVALLATFLLFMLHIAFAFIFVGLVLITGSFLMTLYLKLYLMKFSSLLKCSKSTHVHSLNYIIYMETCLTDVKQRTSLRYM